MRDSSKDCSTGISPKTLIFALHGISDLIFNNAVRGAILFGFKLVSIL